MFTAAQGRQTPVRRDSRQAAMSQLFQQSYDDSQVSSADTSMESFAVSSPLDAVENPYAINFDHSRSFCEQICSCSCHRIGRIKSPYYLNALFGSLLIGYSGRPWETRTCNDTGCRSRSTEITYTYTFPQWFMKRMVKMRMAYDQGGPELCLRVVRVREGSADIFYFTREFNEEIAIHRIKSLLTNGEASVLDVDPDGYSALQVSKSPYAFKIYI